MNKRGQVTTFMIVGFVILVIFVLIFSVRRAGIGVSPQTYLETNLEDLKNIIDDCIEKETTDIVELSEDTERIPASVLIVENRIGYGEKHKSIERFLRDKKLGIDYGTLAFNFVGERALNPWTVPTKYVKNELRLI